MTPCLHAVSPNIYKMTPCLHAISPNTALSCPVLDTVSLQFAKSCTVYALSHPISHRLVQYWTLSRPLFAKRLRRRLTQSHTAPDPVLLVSPSHTRYYLTQSVLHTVWIQSRILPLPFWSPALPIVALMFRWVLHVALSHKSLTYQVYSLNKVTCHTVLTLTAPKVSHSSNFNCSKSVWITWFIFVWLQTWFPSQCDTKNNNNKI